MAFKEAFFLYQKFRAVGHPAPLAVRTALMGGLGASNLKSNSIQPSGAEDKNILFKKILELKNSMNRQRTNFELPKNHKLTITPYWLLGFIEGEGSFSVAKTVGFRLEFNIGQTLSEILVIKAIQNFLLELPGNFKLWNSICNTVQFSQESKSKNERSKPMVRVNIYLTSYILNVLIPFLDNLEWLSKKKLDYEDWKLLLYLKQKGWHFSDEGKDIIIGITNRMNRNRLSTNIESLNYLVSKDLDIKIKLY